LSDSSPATSQPSSNLCRKGCCWQASWKPNPLSTWLITLVSELALCLQWCINTGRLASSSGFVPCRISSLVVLTLSSWTCPAPGRWCHQQQHASSRAAASAHSAPASNRSVSRCQRGRWGGGDVCGGEGGIGGGGGHHRAGVMEQQPA
jgi:hypothetical protein